MAFDKKDEGTIILIALVVSMIWTVFTASLPTLLGPHRTIWMTVGPTVKIDWGTGYAFRVAGEIEFRLVSGEQDRSFDVLSWQWYNLSYLNYVIEFDAVSSPRFGNWRNDISFLPFKVGQVWQVVMRSGSFMETAQFTVPTPPQRLEMTTEHFYVQIFVGQL